jgi:tetratricopeptide (TPR) repeat protein
MIEWFRGNYGKGLAEADRALELMGPTDQVPMLFAAKEMQANNLHGLGRMQEAIRLQEEICGLVEGISPGDRLGAPASARVIARSFLAWFLIETGEFGRATREVEDALETALGAGDTYGEVLARSVLGSCYFLTGDLEESRTCLETALAIANANDFDAIKPNLIGRLGMTMTGLGRVEAGRALFDDFEPHFDAGRTGKIEQFLYRAGRAHSLAASGDPQAGLVEIEQALELARDIENPCLLVKGLGLRCQLQSCLQPAGASSQCDADRNEIAELCARHGLVEWPAPAFNCV